LHDQVVAVGAIEGRNQLVAHFVGIGAANVVAFEKNLTTAAGAHHSVAELVETDIVTGTQEEKNRQHDDGELRAAL